MPGIVVQDLQVEECIAPLTQGVLLPVELILAVAHGFQPPVGGRDDPVKSCGLDILLQRDLAVSGLPSYKTVEPCVDRIFPASLLIHLALRGYVIPLFLIALDPEAEARRNATVNLVKAADRMDAARIAEARGLARFSAQAVGGAVGRNPISLLIPCHRVLGADGSLTGYAGGLERKAALLRLEGVPLP